MSELTSCIASLPSAGRGARGWPASSSGIDIKVSRKRSLLAQDLWPKFTHRRARGFGNYLRHSAASPGSPLGGFKLCHLQKAEIFLFSHSLASRKAVIVLAVSELCGAQLNGGWECRCGVLLDSFTLLFPPRSSSLS